MRFLLDTDVLSASYRIERWPPLKAWLDARSDTDLFISAISIGEIWRGVRKLAGRDPERAQQIEAWLTSVVIVTFGPSILAADHHVMRRWAELATARNNRHDVDLIIAATAAQHGLTVASRNVAHFLPLGVPVIDPTL